MGRPLNKKYFGNRNIGTTGTSDNGIGGEGLATISTPGNYSEITSSITSFPSLVISAPDLPGGVQATAVVTWEIFNGSVAAAGSGYTTGYATSTELDAQASVAPVLYITAAAGGITGLDFSQANSSRGEFASIDGTNAPWTITKTSSNGTMNFNFRVKRITVLEKGSGYTSAPTLSWSGAEGQSVPVDPTATLTTDTGDVGSSTNQENAIIITAYVPAADGGSSAVVGDIIKQQSTRRYKVRTAQGTGIVKLVAGAPAAGEATIVATDANSNTYYVTKLTAHKATLTQIAGGADYVYASGDTARWSFSAASGTDKTAANTTVQIANA